MKYQKNQSIYGAWIKGSDVVPGTRGQLVTEVSPKPSQFKDKNGNEKMQDVGKIRIDGSDEVFNISLNRATIDAMVEAFGEDSKGWIGKPLTVATEKVVVGGRRVTAIYLVPEGYELSEDEAGYVKIVNPNKVEAGNSETARINDDLQAAADDLEDVDTSE